MSEALPSRPNLNWLRKTAKQQLTEQRIRQPDAKLADAQFALARRFGFSSWRSLKAHIEQLQRSAASGPESASDADVAAFLRAVGSGELSAIRSMLTASPQLVNATGPHPYWGGRPQGLHVSIETARGDVFELLLASAADIDGRNEEYEHCSPLTLTILWNQPQMQEELLARGAKIGLVEALLLADDVRVASLLRAGKRAFPPWLPNGGSILAMARTPFAIDRLLELGVARDLKDRWDTTPLEAMSRLGARGLPLVRHMLSRGFRASPQEYARLGDRESLAKLIDADPKITESDDVLMGAVDFGHYDLVEWLLDLGASPNARSSAASRGTALHSAAWEGDLRMVKMLVAAGADVTARDLEHGGTPARFARVAIEVTNNPACQTVADYLDNMERLKQ